MIASEHVALWERINTFPIDDPSASVKFSDKLAFQNHWTKEYTGRVVGEYKKFIFLSCISPSGAAPSKAIDEAWHLHLTYTYNYWKIFCAQVLGREIHHYPSKGGNKEDERHNDWYGDTLRLYKDVFDQDPPPDIWPAPQQLVRDTKLTIAGGMAGMQQYGKYLLLLLIPFIVPFLYGESSPYHLSGPQFLVFYAVLGIVAVANLFFIYRYNEERVTEITEDYYHRYADTYQLARYAFGLNRSKQTAIVDLVERTILEPGKKDRFTFYPSRYHHSSVENNPMTEALLNKYEEGSIIPYNYLMDLYDKQATYNETLEKANRQMNQLNIWQYTPAIFAGIVGVFRLLQGMANDKPVTYLFMMMVILGFAFVYGYKKSSCKDIFRDKIVRRFENNELGDQFSSSSMMTQFAFAGVCVLGSNYLYKNLEYTFNNNMGSGDGYSSSCGSSSCGGGGGGCGGCGGGGH